MRAGLLDQIIDIQYRTDVVNAVGQPIPTWHPFRSRIYAAVDFTRGREFFAGQQLINTDVAMFTVRYIEGLVATMRILYDGKTWDVAAVEEGHGRKQSQRLFCMTGLTEG